MRRLSLGSFVLVMLVACPGEVGSPGAPVDNVNIGSTGSGGNLTSTGGSPPSSTGSATSSTGSSRTGSSAGAATGAASGAGATSGSANTSVTPVDAGAGAGLPCDVQSLLANRCDSCHSAPPLPPSPMALVSRANLLAPALVDMTKTYAQVSVSRMQNTLIPMPPAPATPATPAEIAILQNWIATGYPPGPCGTSASDGGLSGDASAGANPYAVAAVCTSMKYWTSGNSGSMRPGEACIACHARGEGPPFNLAGTVFPTAHEPNDCNGTGGSLAGAKVVVTDKNGSIITMTPDSVGNFSYQGALVTPFTAKVVQNGQERIMVTPQTSGDCNSCHTQAGMSSAPGRIIVP
jgi:hypothetical protein